MQIFLNIIAKIITFLTYEHTINAAQLLENLEILDRYATPERGK